MFKNNRIVLAGLAMGPQYVKLSLYKQTDLSVCLSLPTFVLMKQVVVIDRIMETASRLFFDQGYNLTGINQIIEESNIAKSSLYAHFPSKSDLLLAYLKELDVRWFAGLEAFLEGITDPGERLLGIFDYRVDRQIKSNFGGCAWTKISAEVPKEDLPVFEKVADFKGRLKKYMQDLVKKMDRPSRKLLSDEQLAENIFLLLEGAQVMACVSKTPEALIHARDIIKKLF
jgi:AcrR family transcriptional regulator